MPDYLPEPHSINRELIDDTRAQIEKDLGITDTLSIVSQLSLTPYEQLFPPVLSVVRQLFEKDTAHLPQVLYRIDLSENLVNRILQSDNPAELLADAIIRRCFQKVVLRKMYRK